MSVISQVLAFDVLNTAKSICFGKTVIITVWLRVFNWKCRTTIWHYLAILCQIFMAVSLFLTDWEHVSWVTFFFAHLVYFVFYGVLNGLPRKGRVYILVCFLMFLWKLQFTCIADSFANIYIRYHLIFRVKQDRSRRVQHIQSF